ncbi:hypothetical protein T492DRAFT_943561 [Pavlovales sp. CCMP2436]|nr:hypothetical protein T492DRAFT_943561 [Pavlovales sp. CCMP2436]
MAEVRSIYRQILRAAARWPSIRRNAVMVEIRQEFKDNARCPPAQKEKLMQQAYDGLDTLQRQTRARTDSSFSFR